MIQNTRPALKSGSIINLIIVFPIFSTITVGVLLVIDMMECFLHVIRLHWVEFQSKFYKGQGY